MIIPFSTTESPVGVLMCVYVYMNGVVFFPVGDGSGGLVAS